MCTVFVNSLLQILFVLGVRACASFLFSSLFLCADFSSFFFFQFGKHWISHRTFKSFFFFLFYFFIDTCAFFLLLCDGDQQNTAKKCKRIEVFVEEQQQKNGEGEKKRNLQIFACIDYYQFI